MRTPDDARAPARAVRSWARLTHGADDPVDLHPAMALAAAANLAGRGTSQLSGTRRRFAGRLALRATGRRRARPMRSGA